MPFQNIDWEEIKRKSERRRMIFEWLCAVFDRALAEDNVKVAEDALMSLGVKPEEIGRV